MTFNAASAVLKIAIPVPFRKTYEYLMPKNNKRIPEPGVRVEVPFGRTTKVGLVVKVTDTANYPRNKLKAVNEILDDSPIFEPQHMDWLRWISQYYHHPLGETLFTALPVALRKNKLPKAELIKTWQLTDEGKNIDPSSLSKAPRQQAIINWFQDVNRPVSKSELDDVFDNWSSIIKSLINKSLISALESTPLINNVAIQGDQPPQLNEEQSLAVNKITVAQDKFGVFLLDGVTGSGKTEVYLGAIKNVIDAGHQVLFLLPEIGLTPQLLQRFKNRYGDSIGTMHSGMNDTERYRVWDNIRQGKLQILIGTRSAIFTPFKSLGMILIDEEHDLSFKQQDGLRYSARDIAISRANQQQIPVVLGSATPSLETLSNLRKPTFTHLTLKQRAGKAIAPRIKTIDLTHQKLEHNLSPILIKQMQKTLDKGEQVLLFLNRRGFAPAMICHECGWLAICHRCDRQMTIHHQRQRVVCHHCGSEKKLPAQCPQCSCLDLRPLGFGTERMEQFLTTLFPDTEIIRIDRDTTSRKNAMHKLLAKIKNDEGQILLGTQMLAKGHDFPNVTFVGIIDADQGLFGADMRSAERMAQLITQVAGRAGRGDKPGEVAIQTLHPEHPLLQILINQGYASFSQSALQERKDAQLPPYTFAAMIRTESTQLGYNFQFLNDLKNLFATQNAEVELLGPAPSPMERKAGKFRTQLLLLSQSRSQLHQLLGNTLNEIETMKSARKVRWSLDIDPMEMS